MYRINLKLKENLPQLIGRTVTKIIYTKPTENLGAPCQFIMELDNGATYEVYSRDTLGITDLRYFDKGGCQAYFEKIKKNNCQCAAFTDGKDVQVYEPPDQT